MFGVSHLHRHGISRKKAHAAEKRSELRRRVTDDGNVQWVLLVTIMAILDSYLSFKRQAYKSNTNVSILQPQNRLQFGKTLICF